MARTTGLFAVAVMAVTGSLLCSDAMAGDVYGVRFDPPRVYFAHASINKAGPAAGVRGQDNFLSLYVPPVDNTAGGYKPEGFSYSVLLPAWLEVLDQAEQELTVTAAELGGVPYQKVTRRLDPTQVKQRCLTGKWGISEVLWYRVQDNATVPPALPEIRVTLQYGDKECFTDTARLRIYDELPPVPRVSPRHFRFWLHYGPYYRKGHWDELADWLSRAGINALQFTLGGPESLEYVQAMRQRGFYVIAQRGGSYEGIYRDNMRACLEQGPGWFAKADQGTMATYLPHADAALWDFEPSPLPTAIDDWLIAEFRRERKLAADVVLTKETIGARYLREWIDFRQNQLATCVRHWGDFCRSVKPDIATILTEGSALAFDPPGQIDYARCQDAVTFCDPMNFTGLGALHVMRQWMQHAPRAHFTGCQNVGLSSYHNIFVSPPTIMLQIVSAALSGMHGTAIYPGPAMDADNFVLFNRAMGFLGRNQDLVFEGERDPAAILVSMLPKESQTITLGDGRKLQNTYPDWSHDAIQRCYRSPGGDASLVAITNWNAKEPCFARLTLSLPAGKWLLTDDERRQVYVSEGQAELDAAALARGVMVQCPAFDFLGVRVQRSSAAAVARVAGYRQVSLAEVEQAAQTYSQSGTGAAGALAQGDQRLTFDDYDRDGKFEYLVQSPGQQVWVSQEGTIVRWTVGGETLETEGLGLARDMLWLPQGERENRGMDAVMRLEDRQVRPDGVTLTFSKDVALAAMGGGASVRLVKELGFGRAPGELTVRVRLANTSVAPEATSLPLSYRMHNYLKYGVEPSAFWSYDGSALSRWDDVQVHYTVPNTGLDEQETGHLFTQCEVVMPRRLVSFGDYRPERRLLLKIVPAHPERLLQLLRWGRHALVAGSGTVEWMTRPETLTVGTEAVHEFRFRLQPQVSALDAQTAAPAPVAAATAPAADEHLLLHLSFDGTAEATTATGNGKATIKGTPTYEPTPGGQGICIGKGVELSYLPEGNINLRQGKLAIRFKPAWEGADGQTHFLLTVRPKTGFMYVGKLADGRLVCNMFDEGNKQHYPWHLIRTLTAGTWHETTVTWDTAKGTLGLYLDGEKVAEHRGDPWQMAALDNRLAHCRLVIPEQAEAVIDDIKVWDTP